MISTEKKTIKHKGVLEHKGILIIINDDETTKEEFTNEELWFISKANKLNVDTTEKEALAKIWSSKKNIGCVYPNHIEKKIQEIDKPLYYR